ncbi:MAG: integrin alpha, partial [Chloroflexi bacterium]|nr:integrin alpha [Chloroflexota bacterium]
PGQLDDYDQFGASLARLGDLDGDGTIDLAAGADLDDDGAQGSGAVWILFLSPSGVKSQAKISASSGLALTAFDRLGTGVAALGDVDGDGLEDLAAGATGDDDGGLSRGAVWILFLDSAGGARGWQKISSTEGNFGGALSNGDSFGVSLAALGDLDRDGRLDLAVGAENDDDGGSDTGAAWILFLESLSTPNPVIRNGSGVNRVLLTASHPPAIGSTWEVQVDCSGHRPSFVFHCGADAPANGPIIPVLGEWLVGFYRPRLFQAIAAHAGNTVTISHWVPPDLNLIGTPFYSQAIVGGKPAPELTNALDGTATQ